MPWHPRPGRVRDGRSVCTCVGISATFRGIPSRSSSLSHFCRHAARSARSLATHVLDDDTNRAHGDRGVVPPLSEVSERSFSDADEFTEPQSARSGGAWSRTPPARSDRRSDRWTDVARVSATAFGSACRTLGARRSTLGRAAQRVHGLSVSRAKSTMDVNGGDGV